MIVFVHSKIKERLSGRGKHPCVTAGCPPYKRLANSSYKTRAQLGGGRVKKKLQRSLKMMRSTGLLLGLVLVLHLTSSFTIWDQQVPEETDNYKSMEEKRGSFWSKGNQFRDLSKRPWHPFHPKEKPYVVIHEFTDNDINNLEKKNNMFRASKRMNFRPTKRSSSDLDLDDLPITKRFRATKRVPEFVSTISEDDIDNVKRQNSMFFRASK